jgi:hypothetical protein
MYREEAFRFSYAHYFSNGAGLVSWFGALIIAITALPWFRRHMYWVRQCNLLSRCLHYIFSSFLHLICCDKALDCHKECT